MYPGLKGASKWIIDPAHEKWGLLTRSFSLLGMLAFLTQRREDVVDCQHLQRQHPAPASLPT
jgi:hypothetical protein